MVKGTKKFWYCLAGILALIVSVAMFTNIINSALATINPDLMFLTDANVAKILSYIMNHGIIAVLICSTFAILANSKFIFKVIFIIVIAGIILYYFFPNTYNDLIIIINESMSK